MSENYTRVRKTTNQQDIQPNEIRITKEGKVRSYIQYAVALLDPSLLKQDEQQEEANNEQKTFDQIVLKGMGKTISKAVSVAEVIKRRVPGLHQINEIQSTTIVDEFEPKTEGLPKISQPRVVSVMNITLSKTPLDTTNPGYQVPIAAELVQPIQAAPRKKKAAPAATETTTPATTTTTTTNTTEATTEKSAESEKRKKQNNKRKIKKTRKPKQPKQDQESAPATEEKKEEQAPAATTEQPAKEEGAEKKKRRPKKRFPRKPKKEAEATTSPSETTPATSTEATSTSTPEGKPEGDKKKRNTGKGRRRFPRKPKANKDAATNGEATTTPVEQPKQE